LIGALGNLGGLYSLTLFILTGIYHFLGEPFRNLHLALSFNQMKNAICRQESLQTSIISVFDQQFDDGLTFGFQIYYFLLKRLPDCLFTCCFSDKDSDDLTFKRLALHHDELISQVKN
jgi:hypothetical protein